MYRGSAIQILQKRKKKNEWLPVGFFQNLDLSRGRKNHKSQFTIKFLLIPKLVNQHA